MRGLYGACVLDSLNHTSVLCGLWNHKALLALFSKQKAKATKRKYDDDDPRWEFKVPMYFSWRGTNAQANGKKGGEPKSCWCKTEEGNADGEFKIRNIKDVHSGLVGSFRCDNGNCVIGSKKCDGVNDCGDGTDESKSVCGACANFPTTGRVSEWGFVYVSPCV